MPAKIALATAAIAVLSITVDMNAQRVIQLSDVS
jgi:hypothetical protein